MCIGSRCVQIHTLSYWSLKVPTWHHMAKNSLRILKDVLLRYMKMAKAKRRLSTAWNWAAAQWLRSSSVLKVRGPLRTGLRYVVQRSWAHVLSVTSKCFLWKVGVGVLSALLQRLKRRGITLHQISVLGSHPRRKPLLKTIHKKTSKQFAEDMSTKHMDYWNHGLWSDGMKINLFGSDGFKHVCRRSGEEYKDKCVMPSVKHGGGDVMV